MFICSGTDRVAILQRDNDEIRYNSISRGEECILKKFVRRKDVERCENLEREHCEPEVRKAVQINMVKGCVSAVLVHAILVPVYLDSIVHKTE